MRLCRRTRRAGGSRRQLLVALVGLCLLGASGYLGASYWRVKRHEWEADAALQRYDFPQACVYLKMCVEASPNRADLHLQLARAARRAGQLDMAERHLERCRTLQGPADPILLERVLGEVQQGKLASHEEYVVACAREDIPEADLCLEALAQGYLAAGSLVHAATAATRLLQRQPNHVPALLWRARALEGLRQFGQAREDYQRIVELAPDHEQARTLLADALLEAGQVPEAETHFAWLHARRPGDPNVALGLAACWRRLGRFDEAARLLDVLLAMQPGNATTLLERGKLTLESGRLEEAEGWLRRAVAAAPHEQQANYALYQCLQQRGKSTEAAPFLTEVKRGEADLKRLEEVFRQMFLHPSDLALRYEAGILYLRNGQAAQGVRWLENVLKQDPEHAAAHQALAAHYERIGDTRRAAQHRRPLPPTGS